jgi:tetratricopeptide (TPR) repeat protein
MIAGMVLLVMLSSMMAFADGDSYTYTKDSLLDDTDDKQIYDTSSADYLFEYGLELLKGRMYEESIQKFTELRIKFPDKLVSRMSHIYEGIARVWMSSEYRNGIDAFKSLDKYYYIIQNLTYFAGKPSEDLILLYTSLSDRLRQLDATDFSLQGYMEYSLLFFDDETRSGLYPEIAYMHYLRGDFYSAISLFERSESFKSQLGLAKSYTAIGDVDKAIVICKDLKQETSGKELSLLNKYYSYIKSLSTTSPSDDDPYSVNAEGKPIIGNYKIFVGTYTDESKSRKARGEATNLLEGKEFSVNPNSSNDIYTVASVNVVGYGDAKIAMEKLIRNGYDNAFIKDISF